MNEHICKCSKEAELESARVKIEDLERRCDNKDKIIETIRLETIPDLITDHIRPLFLKVVMLEAWQKWTIFYAPAILGLLIYIFKPVLLGK